MSRVGFKGLGCEPLFNLQEHGECVTIKTRFRPVPLRWLFGYRSFPSHGVVLSDLTDSSGRKLNDRLRLDKWVQAEQRYVSHSRAEKGFLDSLGNVLPVNLGLSTDLICSLQAGDLHAVDMLYV
jgi:hypothetical protein